MANYIKTTELENEKAYFQIFSADLRGDTTYMALKGYANRRKELDGEAFVTIEELRKINSDIQEFIREYDAFHTGK